MKPWRLGLALTVLVGCSSGADEPYKPAPAWSGRKPTLPAPPSLPTTPIKVADAYTIHGASHHLRSRIHDKDVTKANITIIGYIVADNIAEAPKCAIHKLGKKDPDDCPAAGQPPIEIPSFWIADEKDAGPDKPRIRVLGWAKNWATVFEAMEKYKHIKEIKNPEKDYFKDDQWSVDVPYPLPSVGAKVKVTGKYGYVFSKASSGLVSDPVNGVMTYEKVEYVEPAPSPAAFKNK
ncbi:MAG: hypothetical protein KIT84_14420 [Labilithrix sp.]|nr:hypothetical protein [Labilithrix sp.]MCW5812216.1 hypothetical protein [Labilithrix sp.]